jgi:hypothetical protein
MMMDGDKIKGEQLGEEEDGIITTISNKKARRTVGGNKKWYG